MHNLSALQIRDQFQKGQLSAKEIATYFLKRIETHDPEIGAFLTVYNERVIKKATELDEKKKAKGTLGKLAGVPIALKDNIHINGEITTCGSKFLANYRAVFDATVTKLLEKEDALIIGKTNLDEFAMGSSTENSAFMKTKNPWALDCVPGGSSGGSTAAVAARLVPISLGSDTGGSVRQPAAFCGVFGFKPTYGRVSRYGVVAFASSLDQIGPIAWNSEDIGLAMEVLGKPDKKDATSLAQHGEDYLSFLRDGIKGKKIGVPWEFIEGVSEEVKAIFKESIEVYKKLGCEIVDIDLNILKYSVATYYIVATAEASTNLARFDGIRFGVRSSKATTLDEVYDLSKAEGFGPEVKKRILLGTYVLSSGYQDAFYKQATKVRAKIIEEFAKVFGTVDLIATPVAPNAAFQLNTIQDPLQMYLQDIYTIGVNLAYLPAVSIPCGFTKEKKPLGLQLIGAKRDDVLLVRMAHAFEQQKPYGHQVPSKFSE